MKDYTQYIGIPFVSLGRDKTGADCWGLVRLILEEQYGIMVPTLLDYTDALDNVVVSNVINKQTPLVTGEQLEEPVEGCIVILRSKGLIGHVGLYIGNNTILHTTKQTGAITESINNRRLKNKIKGYYSVDTSYYTK